MYYVCLYAFMHEVLVYAYMSVRKNAPPRVGALASLGTFVRVYGAWVRELGWDFSATPTAVTVLQGITAVIRTTCGLQT